MGQFEIFEFLKQNRSKWWNSKDLADALGISKGSATNGLKKLRKRRDILHKESKKNRYYLYKFCEA